MLFVRGERDRYDEWSEAGCPGWSYADLLPFFKNIEDYRAGDPAWRGTGGPVTVTRIDKGDGTLCPMGAGADAVVDAELRVHGMAGLRVADASVMPFHVSSNTNVPAMLIGEKAADLILRSS